MKYKEMQACYRQAKRNSRNISDFIKQMKFEIFLCNENKRDISKV